MTSTSESNSDKKKSYNPHQKLLSTYITSKTLYRGILLYHGLGSGKTATAINIAEKFKILGQKTIVIVPASLEANFRDEIVDWAATDKYSCHKSWKFLDANNPALTSDYLDQYGMYGHTFVHAKKIKIDGKEISKKPGLWVFDEDTGYAFEDLPNSKEKRIS